MAIDKNAMVSIGKLIILAQELKSHDGEEPAYDRALVDLISDATSLRANLRHEVAIAVGVKLAPEPKPDKRKDKAK